MNLMLGVLVNANQSALLSWRNDNELVLQVVKKRTYHH